MTMQELLTLSKFKNYIAENNFCSYYLLTENQFNYDYYGTISMSLEFDEIIVSFRPTFIVLKQGKNYVRFDRPVYVCVENDYFIVICSKRDAKAGEFEFHTVVAERPVIEKAHRYRTGKSYN